MKLFPAAALVTLFAAAAPAFAADAFLVDFEKTWSYDNGDIAEYYNGAQAGDGTTGPNLGVSFVNVSGLSNDALGTYYSGAPSMQGVAYAYGTSYMNVGAGVDNALSFFYASTDVSSISAYSGLNGTGTLLGTINLAATGGFGSWQQATLSFTGTALSFDLSNTTNVAALDNISAVPEPGAMLMLAAGLTTLTVARRRRG